MFDSRHPSYKENDYAEYRLVYEGGAPFIRKYLRKHYDESAKGWEDRSEMTYDPAYAAEAVDEYVRAISQRFSDVKREGGRKLYHKIIEGEVRGVDNQGASLDNFFSQKIVPELLSMGTVGVYIDRAPVAVTTVDKEEEEYPYFIVYKAEDILNWAYNPNDKTKLKTVLLAEKIEDLNEHGLSIGLKKQYRLISTTEKGIVVQLFDEDGKAVGPAHTQNTAFPFVLINIKKSLLKRTARHQIALLNICSADLYYAWASNAPIYTEQSSALDGLKYREHRTPEQDIAEANAQSSEATDALEAALSGMAPTTKYENGERKITIGATRGRRYPVGSERPAFIHPSSEPLIAGMKKEEQIKNEIRQLTALAVASLAPTSNVSAAAKSMDNLGLEAGMTFIGQVLESAENSLSRGWHSYFKDNAYTRSFYPAKYDLKTDAERRADAQQLQDLHQAVTSRTYQRTIAKQIATVLLERSVKTDILQTIYKEIDASPAPTADPEALRLDHEAGFVSNRTASIGRGYDPDEYLKAEKDHEERIARVAIAQQTALGARGIKDMDADPKSAEKEKENASN